MVWGIVRGREEFEFVMAFIKEESYFGREGGLTVR